MAPGLNGMPPEVQKAFGKSACECGFAITLANSLTMAPETTMDGTRANVFLF